MPSDSCWKLETENITELKNNEILIEAEYLSIDPYMRGRMNAGLSYAAPVNLGDVMVGESVGRVVESKSKNYNVGDLVTVHQGWQTYIQAKDSDPTIIKVPESNLPSSVFLGTLGMPGRTAYFGLNHVGKPKAGETLVVSAASGAVGSVVGQLGKLMGCKVIGIAGGQEKSQYVANELGFDQCIHYKNENVGDKPQEYCPNGIDIYLNADFVTPEKITELENKYLKNAFVADVSYDKPLINLLTKNIKRISFWLLIVSGFFVLIAIILINSSIRLSIYAKRFNIKTMQMVGATKSFIRKPFIIQSIKLGFIGAFVALIGLGIVIYYLDKYIPSLDFLKDYVTLTYLTVGVLVGSFIITWLSTFFATQRFLNLKTDELYY